MKVLFVGMSFLVSVAGTSFAGAQTNATNSVAAPSPLAILTSAEQVQYATAHQKALEDNPALKSEGEQLLEQGRHISSPAEAQVFGEKMNSHRQKLRQAMLKEDPTLGPLFTKIDRHLSQMKAQAQASPSPNSTDASGTPAGPH